MFQNFWISNANNKYEFYSSIIFHESYYPLILSICKNLFDNINKLYSVQQNDLINQISKKKNINSLIFSLELYKNWYLYTIDQKIFKKINI